MQSVVFERVIELADLKHVSVEMNRDDRSTAYPRRIKLLRFNIAKVVELEYHDQSSKKKCSNEDIQASPNVLGKVQDIRRNT